MQNSLPAERLKVLILHAYSPLNTGDGLLVDLTREVVARALGDADTIVIASNAAAFGDTDTLQWGPFDRSPVGELPRRLMMLATILLGSSPRIRRLARDADLIVAVGGAYLRGSAPIEVLKTRGAHFGQLSLAARYGAKTVYLPQSIGPFSDRAGRQLRERLGRVRRVYARDDRTFDELVELGNVRRAPDLAVLAWAQDPPHPLPLTGDLPLFVARELPNPRRYHTLLEEVARSGRFEWAVQSTGGDNDDGPLIRRHSSTEPRMLRNMLAEQRPRVVVSTRLHGSLAALLAGYPTIHLSYERKGWSAFADLGLDHYVLSARDTTLADIEDRIESIHANLNGYWEHAIEHIGRIQRCQSEIIADLQETVGLRPGSEA